VVFLGSQVTIFAPARPSEHRDLRHGASKTQKAALSQNPIRATTHRRQGTLSLVRRSSPMVGIVEAEAVILEPNLLFSKRRLFARPRRWRPNGRCG
jgi:hypothetical protein